MHLDLFLNNLQFENNTLPANVTNEQLWQARKIKESAVHPETGEIIPRPFRMAGYGNN